MTTQELFDKINSLEDELIDLKYQVQGHPRATEIRDHLNQMTNESFAILRILKGSE